jgi:catechol 2,3-dioxygenase-like lactoylglutathione lyase family enzyme
MLAGVHHVKFPVTDVERSRAWYEQVFGLQVDLEFPDESGVVRGVGGRVPGLGDCGIALRENADAAGALKGFDPVSFGVRDRNAMQAWMEHLDDCGVPHSPLIEASVGYLLVFDDPDGTSIHLYSWDRHGIDTTGRPGYGRPVQA